MSKRTYNSIDLWKLIMAFCVVAIHTSPLYNCNSTILTSFHTSFVGLAVPFFFLASGFFLASKFQKPFNSAQNISIVKSYLLRIVKMYVLWMLIYTPMAIYKSIIDGRTFLMSLLLYVRGLFFIGEQYNSWHLWYLLSTIYALILVLIFLSKNVKLKHIVLFGCAIYAFHMGVTFLSEYNGTLPTFLNLLNKAFKLIFANGSVLRGAFYIPVGMYISQKGICSPSQKIYACIMMIGGYLLNVLVNASEPHFSQLSTVLTTVCAIGLFSVIKDMSLPNSPIFPIMRNMSTTIYFIHMYVWTFYYMIVYREKTYGMDSFIATLIVSILISGLYIYLKNKLRAKKISIQSQNSVFANTTDVKR